MSIYFSPRVNWLKNISRYSQCYQVVTKSADNIFTVRKLYKSASLLLQYVRHRHQLISGVSARVNGGSVCLSACPSVILVQTFTEITPAAPSAVTAGEQSLCALFPLFVQPVLRQFLFDVWFFRASFIVKLCVAE